MRRDKCLTAIHNRDINELLRYDQLRKQISRNPAHRLRRFQEGTISFLPSYKYDPGTDVYDTSKKSRVPAYCDRILWYAPLGSNACSPQGLPDDFDDAAEREKEPPPPVQCLAYWRGETPCPSDHRPVMARFALTIRRVNPELRNDVIKALREEWPKVQEMLIRDAVNFHSAAVQLEKAAPDNSSHRAT